MGTKFYSAKYLRVAGLGEIFVHAAKIFGCMVHVQCSCTLGHLSSHGRPAMTSTASAPPTPTRTPPRPPRTRKIQEKDINIIQLNSYIIQFIEVHIFYTLIKRRGNYQCPLRTLTYTCKSSGYQQDWKKNHVLLNHWRIFKLNCLPPLGVWLSVPINMSPGYA